MNEIELVKKIQSGDMNALGQIFEIYKNSALKYSYIITGNKFTSEDIVQETFIKFYLNAKALKNPEQFKPWFFKILTRTAWKRVGKEKKNLPVENIFEKAAYESIDESIHKYIRNQEEEALRVEIEHLDLKMKTVIVLYYFNGFTVKEIAKIMGTFEGTVKSRLYKARKKLKENLVNNEEGYIEKAKECGI